MLCTCFLAGARGRLVVAVAFVLAILAMPTGASAKAHGAAVGHHASAAIVRVGDGYATPGGSRGVRWIQRRLHTLGYDAGPTDGLFGPLTEAAVSRFQRDHRLASDGVVGPHTAARLRTATAILELGTGYRTPRGSQRVRTIQRRLRALHYEPGPIDGRFGPRTERAVARFQADHRLAADGDVGPQTSKRLLARPTATPVADRAAARPPAIPDMPTATKPLRTRRPLAAAVPQGPPVEAMVVALIALGVAAFAFSYLRTRTRIAKAVRGSTAMSAVDGNGGRPR